MGHITRIIPLIKELQNRGHHVITCGDSVAKNILIKEFESIRHILIDGYKPYYSNSKNQTIALIKQLPKFFKTVFLEKKQAEKIVSNYQIDIIIADNRFGFRSKNTKNIFISHQINIHGSWLLSKFANYLNHYFISKFEICWVPDLDQNLLSGNLSKSKLTTINIGPLSRFKNLKLENTKGQYKYLAIISGPEPQRKLFEEELIKVFLSQDYPCAIINGTSSVRKKYMKNITFFSHQPTKKFFKLISISEMVICRSGYSSIMDFYFLRKKVLFVPTPGQTEQEYLAEYHKNFNGIEFLKQDEIFLKERLFKIMKLKENSQKNLLALALKKIDL